MGLRLRFRARAGIFFVAKKDDTLRMVVDGREPSSLRRRPPHTGLGSAAAISALDLSLADSEAGPNFQVHGASADLRQGFYQLTWRSMASWFGFDYPEPISEFGKTAVYDENTGCEIMAPPDALVYPCCEGLAMGWSWSLHFCNLPHH